MRLTCNGEPLDFPTNAREWSPERAEKGVRTRASGGANAQTLADLLSWRLDDPRPPGIAVAVNDEVVPRDDWSRWLLTDGDVIEIVTAVQGG